MNLEVPISWQAQHLVNLEVQIYADFFWQAQHLVVKIEVQISLQAQHLVNLEVLFPQCVAKGSRLTLGGLGVEPCSRSVVSTSATVRNRSR